MGNHFNRQPQNLDMLDSHDQPFLQNTKHYLSDYTPTTSQFCMQKSLLKNRRLEKQIELKQKSSTGELRWYNKVYFSPDSNLIIGFKCVSLLSIYTYLLEIPIIICFDIFKAYVDDEETQTVFTTINFLAIFIFMLGIFIRIKTGFYREGQLIKSQRQILINYVKYMLVFDFLSISSVLIYQLSGMFQGFDNNQSISYRLLIICFFLKIPEIADIERSIVYAFELKRRLKASFKIIMLMAKILFLCNVAACFFFYISLNACPNDGCYDCCWIDRVEKMGKTLRQGSWSVQYVFSLYWASTTMLSIGYGDIIPENIPQVIYTISAQFISCALFAFFINEIWSIFQEKNSKKTRINSRMNVINVYMRDKNIDGELRSRVNAYLYHFYHKKSLREKQLEGQIMSELTPSLRTQIFFQAYGFIFKKHSFFKMFSQQFLEIVSKDIKQVGFFQSESIFEPQTESQSLFYVDMGEVQSFIELGNQKTENIAFQLYGQGKLVGLYEFVRQINYRSSLLALKYSLLYVLDYQDWKKTLVQSQEDWEQYFVEKHRNLYENNFCKLQLNCMLCKSKQHQTDMCLQKQIQDKTFKVLSNYLAITNRAKYTRRNFKLNDMKSLHHVLEPIPKTSNSNGKQKCQRKNSVNMSPSMKVKQFPKQLTNKKKIFQKKVHHQKMLSIIQMQKLKQEWSESSSSQGSVMNLTDTTIEQVQNYELYFPMMNANNDWTKDKRINAVQKIFKDL